MKICIVLNGEIKDYDYINNIIRTSSYDYIICSDGGANHAYNMDILPDYIIGDLDSTDDTMKILNKLSKDYDGIKVINWKECKEVIDSIKGAE